MNEKLQKLTTYIRGSQVSHTLEKKHRTGVTPSQQGSSPVRCCSHRTWCCCHVLNRWFPFEKSTQLPNGWLMPWIQLDPAAFNAWRENSGKGGKAPLLEVTLRTTAVGCSCWHSRESGKIVVNPPGEGGCFMPSPTGCWWGQPRAGRDTCSTGIVPFFGLATERGGKGGEQ